jgi:hypothetical protein
MLCCEEVSGENYGAAHSVRIVDADQYPPGRLCVPKTSSALIGARSSKQNRVLQFARI